MSVLQINIRIAQCVNKLGDPLLEHIRSALPDIAYDVVDAVVQAMCKCGALRQKEDIYEHDWSYVLTRHGKECYRVFIAGGEGKK